MNTPTVLDPLALPLHGRQVIEASAGTGKTWTLSALYLRMVLGLRDPVASQASLGSPLLPPQILVMTFTEAATAELRDRIRERLAQAAQFFRGQTQVADDLSGDSRHNFAVLSLLLVAKRGAVA